MRKSKFLIKKIICFAIALFLCAIPFIPKFTKSNTLAANVIPENNQRTTSTKSTFIHSPTYSVIYHNDVFFFDEYDNKIKKYNISNSIVDENSLSIEDLEKTLEDKDYGDFNDWLDEEAEADDELLKSLSED